MVWRNNKISRFALKETYAMKLTGPTSAVIAIK
jgi:hypothetical protein